MTGPDTVSSVKTRLGKALAVGVGAGIIASLVMAMYAMGASYVKDTGFFTPLYHIASLWADPKAMMDSMMADKEGADAVTWVGGTAVLGALIHMMTGAMYGVLFALGVARLRLGAAPLVGLGLVFGALVFVVSAYVGLPAAAAIFDAGDPIKNMAEMAGWGVFFTEHLLYGVVLGALVAAGLRKRA